VNALYDEDRDTSGASIQAIFDLISTLARITTIYCIDGLDTSWRKLKLRASCKVL
jgi:hypothetical protein